MYTVLIFFFKQKTAYEMRISDWSSDVCSSDLRRQPSRGEPAGAGGAGGLSPAGRLLSAARRTLSRRAAGRGASAPARGAPHPRRLGLSAAARAVRPARSVRLAAGRPAAALCDAEARSEEHTSELQSLMRIASAVFSLKQ